MWRVFAAIAATCIMLLLWPEALVSLRWQREALDAGESWRVISAHFVHMSLLHALLNLAGLALVFELLGVSAHPAEAVLVMLISALAIIGGLALLNPAIHWYAGLSGVVHGLWAGLALLGLPGCRWRPGSPQSATALSFAALAVLALKLSGLPLALPLPLPGLALASGLPVVPESHLYGAIGGAAAALMLIAGGRQAMRMKCGLE